MVEGPDRIYIDESDKRIIQSIDDDPDSEVRLLLGNPSRSRKEQFLFFMSVGVNNHSKIELTKRDQGGFFLLKDLKTEDEALIDAVAMWDQKNAEILFNRMKVLQIAEEYFHGGINLFHDSASSRPHGSFLKWVEANLWESFNGI